MGIGFKIGVSKVRDFGNFELSPLIMLERILRAFIKSQLDMKVKCVKVEFVLECLVFNQIVNNF